MNDIKIQVSKNYSQFKLIKENRSVANKQVNNLMRSFEEENLMEIHPIIVDKDMQVIDGQHRLEACKRLGLPVYYVVAERANMDSVRRLNYYTRQWKLEDYVDSFAKEGKESYKILRKFMSDNSVPASTAAIMFATDSSTGNQLTSSIRNGTFDARGLSVARRIVSIAGILEKHGEENIWKNKSFMRAVVKMTRLPQFKEDIFAIKVNEAIKSGGRLPYLFHNQVDIKSFLREFEEVYNFNMKTNLVRFF